MNSENSKISESHRLFINFADKINLNRSDKYVALSNPTTYQLQHRMKNLI